VSNKVLTKDELREHLMQLANGVNQKMKGDTAMSKQHKHADLIHEWAEGATIQGRADANMEWLREMNPGWYQDWEYRVEPRTVKREGWANIYGQGKERWLGNIHPSKEIAEGFSVGGVIAYVEWEEKE
jgi:hypothetical protein